MQSCLSVRPPGAAVSFRLVQPAVYAEEDIARVVVFPDLDETYKEVSYGVGFKKEKGSTNLFAKPLQEKRLHGRGLTYELGGCVGRMCRRLCYHGVCIFSISNG